jgi:hypothetical protein
MDQTNYYDCILFSSIGSISTIYFLIFVYCLFKLCEVEFYYDNREDSEDIDDSESDTDTDKDTDNDSESETEDESENDNESDNNNYHFILELSNDRVDNSNRRAKIYYDCKGEVNVADLVCPNDIKCCDCFRTDNHINQYINSKFMREECNKNDDNCCSVDIGDIGNQCKNDYNMNFNNIKDFIKVFKREHGSESTNNDSINDVTQKLQKIGTYWKDKISTSLTNELEKFMASVNKANNDNNQDLNNEKNDTNTTENATDNSTENSINDSTKNPTENPTENPTNSERDKNINQNDSFAFINTEFKNLTNILKNNSIDEILKNLKRELKNKEAKPKDKEEGNKEEEDKPTNREEGNKEDNTSFVFNKQCGVDETEPNCKPDDFQINTEELEDSSNSCANTDMNSRCFFNKNACQSNAHKRKNRSTINKPANAKSTQNQLSSQAPLDGILETIFQSKDKLYKIASDKQTTDSGKKIVSQIFDTFNQMSSKFMNEGLGEGLGESLGKGLGECIDESIDELTNSFKSFADNIENPTTASHQESSQESSQKTEQTGPEQNQGHQGSDTIDNLTNKDQQIYDEIDETFVEFGNQEPVELVDQKQINEQQRKRTRKTPKCVD